MSKQVPSLGRIVHVAEPLLFNEQDGSEPVVWRAGIVIEERRGDHGVQDGFGVAVLSPREQRYDVALRDCDVGKTWRWPPFVPPKKEGE